MKRLVEKREQVFQEQRARPVPNRRFFIRNSRRNVEDELMIKIGCTGFSQWEGKLFYVKQQLML